MEGGRWKIDFSHVMMAAVVAQESPSISTHLRKPGYMIIIGHSGKHWAKQSKLTAADNAANVRFCLDGHITIRMHDSEGWV